MFGIMDSKFNKALEFNFIIMQPCYLEAYNDPKRFNVFMRNCKHLYVALHAHSYVSYLEWILSSTYAFAYCYSF